MEEGERDQYNNNFFAIAYFDSEENGSFSVLLIGTMSGVLWFPFASSIDALPFSTDASFNNGASGLIGFFAQG